MKKQQKNAEEKTFERRMRGQRRGATGRKEVTRLRRDRYKGLAK